MRGQLPAGQSTAVGLGVQQVQNLTLRYPAASLGACLPGATYRLGFVTFDGEQGRVADQINLGLLADAISSLLAVPVKLTFTRDGAQRRRVE